MRHARDRLERRQRRQRQHRHHHLAEAMRVDRIHTEGEHSGHRRGEADADDQGGGGAQPRVAALERIGAGAELLDGAQRGVAGPEGQELGRAAERVHDLGRQRTGEVGHLVVAAAPPGEQRRHGQRERQGEAERQGGPREDHADGHRADHAGADGDRHREQRAEVEILQRVDVVDGPHQQVAAPPPRQRRGHPRREAVVEPDPPAREGAERGVVADEALRVAEWSAEEGEHLDGGQDADDRVEPRPQGGPAHHVARAGQQADGRRSGRQAEEPGEREPPVGRARVRRGRGGWRPAGRSR